MTDTWHLHHRSDEDLYTLPAHDALGILSSTRQVMAQSEYVRINHDQIARLSKEWSEERKRFTSSTAPIWYDRYHFFDGTERSVNWILLLDALNFCFWAEAGEQRWTIEYEGETLNGYWAEAAALKRAITEGIPLWDATYLSTISSATIAHIFRGTGTIPLVEQRVAHAREVGRVLLARFSGQFTHAIAEAKESAVALALLLAEHFPSFRDVAHYRNNEVRFLKRAQICCSDLSSAFTGEKWGAFTDLDQLTIFADYKLPQVLRHYSILEYHPVLAARVDSQQLLPAESPEEIEIRAATIWACEFLRRALMQHGVALTSAEIDLQLWLLGQHSHEMRPYHRTRTIFY